MHTFFAGGVGGGKGRVGRGSCTYEMASDYIYTLGPKFGLGKELRWLLQSPISATTSILVKINKHMRARTDAHTHPH